MTTLIINIKDAKTTETVLARLKDVESIEIEEKTSLKDQILQGLKEVRLMREGKMPKISLAELIKELEEDE